MGHTQHLPSQSVIAAPCRAEARHLRSEAVRAQVMNKICRESEASLDYYSLFKAIMKRAVVPMSPLESLASSAVRTAHKVCHHPGNAPLRLP